MPTIEEASGKFGQGQSPLRDSLYAGIDTISANQTIEFVRYVRLVLPLDGFVFWVRADLVGDSALGAASALNQFALGQGPVVTRDASVIVAKGSFHFATVKRQTESGTFAVNTVTFTSEEPLQDLDKVGPGAIYIGQFGDLRFAFSSHKNFYKQAEVFHYVGDAIYPEMYSQIVDQVDGFDGRSLVVSNSLPFWLSMNGYVPFYGVGNPVLTLFPSFLVPSNIRPPFGSVHVTDTGPLQMTPVYDERFSRSQLVSDRVSVSIYGLRNDLASDFVDAVLQRSKDFDEIGVMNSPVLLDEKNTQVELGIISMKKTVEFQVSYYQRRMRDIARQIVCQAVPSFSIRDATTAYETD